MSAENARGDRGECVFLTSSRGDFEAARQLLRTQAIRCHHAANLDEALTLLGETGARVLLAAAEFAGGRWEDARDMLARFRMRVPLVVVAAGADERFWIEILERGAYDLVQLPFWLEELGHVVANADAQARQTWGGTAVAPSRSLRASR